MVFKSCIEAKEWFYSYSKLDKVIDNKFTNWDFNEWKFGDYILFQHIKSYNGESYISRPIYGIFVEFSYWDLALVINYIEPKRAWTKFNYVNKDILVCEVDSKVESIIIWDDSFHLLNKWRYKPSLKEMKESIRKKIISRNDKLDLLLL